MRLIRRYRWSLIFIGVLAAVGFWDREVVFRAMALSLSTVKNFCTILPSVLVLVGLLDEWVPRETMIRYAGHGSGWRGVAVAFMLGTVAAGPLYVAFPIAGVMLKKGARLAYVLFFLGVWSSAKIPLVFFEQSCFGTGFTFLHVTSSLVLYLLGSFILERLLLGKELDGEFFSAPIQES